MVRLRGFWHRLLSLALLATSAAHAHGEHTAFAPVPPGGVPWTVLGATEAVPWVNDEGVTRLAPRFTPEVEALDGKQIIVSGYMVRFDEGGLTRNVALFASEADCEFHMAPGPSLYIDVWTDAPIEGQLRGPVMVQGVLTLVRARQGGVFYRMKRASITPLKP